MTPMYDFLFLFIEKPLWRAKQTKREPPSQFVATINATRSKILFQGNLGINLSDMILNRFDKNRIVYITMKGIAHNFLFYF